MSSGSYFPPPVKGVSIPKKSGGIRLLGVPTVSDRIAQTVVKNRLEIILEPIFDENSFGYRPKKSAHDAISITRARCWKYDWVVEFDIKGLFDNIDHNLLLKALRKHCSCKWILLYVERWLRAPLQKEDGILVERNKGTPQGGVVSPVLANLFLHYAFDAWVRREMPSIPFCRYADDGLLHCRTQQEAENVMKRITERFIECRLEIQPTKSGIIYCKDRNRTQTYERISFDFLGYTFRPRSCVDPQGRCHPNFLPAISRTAEKAINQEIRSWHIQLKCDKSLEEISQIYEPKLRGWVNYYGRFYKSALRKIFRWRFLLYLVRWSRRKWKRFKKNKRDACKYVNDLLKSNQKLFPSINSLL